MAAGQQGVNFNDFNFNRDDKLTTDECLVFIVKAQASTDGFRRGYPDVCGSQIRMDTSVVNGVTISDVCELYAAPPHGSDDLAVGLEEVVHLAHQSRGSVPRWQSSA